MVALRQGWETVEIKELCLAKVKTGKLLPEEDRERISRLMPELELVLVRLEAEEEAAGEIGVMCNPAASSAKSALVNGPDPTPVPLKPSTRSNGATPLVTSGKTDMPQYVTYDQMAAFVKQSKRTLERWYQEGKLPGPAITGTPGKAHKWIWSEVRPHLEKETGRLLPERFPDLFG